MNTIAKKSVNATNSYVTREEKNSYTSAYKQQRWAASSDQLGRADSLSVWFTMEELESFLGEVKANGGNGVRIHFGVFPENYKRTELVGMQTVVMVANRSKDGSLENAKELLVNRNGNPEILAMDGGMPCPPFCPGGFGKNDGTLIVRNNGGMEVI